MSAFANWSPAFEVLLRLAEGPVAAQPVIHLYGTETTTLPKDDAAEVRRRLVDERRQSDFSC